MATKAPSDEDAGARVAQGREVFGIIFTKKTLNNAVTVLCIKTQPQHMDGITGPIINCNETKSSIK